MGDRETMRGLKELNLLIYNPDKVEGEWEMPIIENDLYVPKTMTGFHEILSYHKADFNRCVHFYISDIMFQRIWNRPKNYVKSLKRFEGMLSPDFSIFMDMPRPLQILNTYRNRLIGQFMQSQGIKVIPTISWGGPKTFEFCFDGIEEEAVVSVASTGVIGSDTRLSSWKAGMRELLNRKRPRIIIFYGTPISFDYGDTEVLYFNNTQICRFDNIHAQKRRSQFMVINSEYGKDVDSDIKEQPVDKMEII